MLHNVIFQNLGCIEYEEALAIQKKYFNEQIEFKLTNRDLKKKNTPSQRVLFCEHPPVFTIGKSGFEKNLLVSQEQLKSKNISLHRISRGGDITFHGPGQLVVYPIFDLEQMNIGVRQYIYNLEETVIQVLSEYHIHAERLQGATGIWIDIQQKNIVRKICAIGVRVSRGITMHGFALNINTDLSYFNYINPCGFTDKSVTSMQLETGSIIDFTSVSETILKKTEKVFQLKSV